MTLISWEVAFIASAFVLLLFVRGVALDVVTHYFACKKAFFKEISEFDDVAVKSER